MIGETRNWIRVTVGQLRVVPFDFAPVKHPEDDPTSGRTRRRARPRLHLSVEILSLPLDKADNCSFMRWHVARVRFMSKK